MHTLIKPSPAHLAGDGLCGVTVVAGEQDNLETHVLQLVHGHCCLVLDSVRNHYQPKEDAWGGLGVREGGREHLTGLE